MEFLDEDARPRFLFQSGAAAAAEPQSHRHKPTKPVLFVTLTLSSLLFAVAIFFLQSEPFQSLLIWLALSILIGPFAPPSLTGGDVLVGRGHIVEFPDEHAIADNDDQKPPQQRRSRSRRSDEPAFAPAPALAKSEHRRGEGNGVKAVAEEEEVKEWTEEDIEILKKQMAKHPVGKPGRWEAIAAAFGGRHRAESVIKKSKELGEKRSDDSDSYEQFLKKRKALDKRAAGGGGGEEEGNVEEESSWSNGEDIALLNALKAFPKDAAMRWEKVAAAVPGKSKAACVKRVAELKKGFRSSKTTS